MSQSEIKCLYDVFDGDEDMVKEVSELFVSYVPDTLNELDEAQLKNDQKGVTRILHRVKGSMGYLGFVNEARVIMQYETQSKTKVPKELDLAPLHQRLSSLVTMIKGEVLTPPPNIG